MLGTDGSHDERRLLTLHQADMTVWIACQQVLAEEALVQLPVLGQHALTDQRYVCPALIAAAMAVGMVLHDVAAVHQPVVVYLPEDDVALVGGAQQVVVVDAPDIASRQVEPWRQAGGEPIPEGALRRVAARDVGHGQRLEGRQRCGHSVLRFSRNMLTCPLVVAVVVGRRVVVAAGVLVVALAHRVGHVLKSVLRVDIAHQALLLSAMRTGELAWLVARQAFTF